MVFKSQREIFMEIKSKQLIPQLQDCIFHIEQKASIEILDNYKEFIKYCVFLPPLPCKHSAAICCKKNYQPIGVTVHSHCVENFEGLLQRYVGDEYVGCNGLWNNTIIHGHPV